MGKQADSSGVQGLASQPHRQVLHHEVHILQRTRHAEGWEVVQIEELVHVKIIERIVTRNVVSITENVWRGLRSPKILWWLLR